MSRFNFSPSNDLAALTLTKDPSTCTHTIERPGRWVDNPYYDVEEAEIGGFSGPQSEWEEFGHEPTSVDIDLHHYKCTQCGLVRPY